MARFKRQEIEAAFEKYQAAALKGAQTKDWRDWADCFTEDATYNEHLHGRFWGRERIFQWITDTMNAYPGPEMTAFPITWYSIDTDKGWIFCEVMNRMQDLGDRKIHQAPNITILHYAGNGLFSYEEDAYNPTNFGTMLQAYEESKTKMATKKQKKS